MRRLAIVLLTAIPLTVAAAEQAGAAKEEKVLPVGGIIHDLRDFIPYADPSKGKAEDALHNFSVTSGYFTGYKADDSDGDGYLSRGDVIKIVARLKAQLRKSYPDTFAAIDTDGDEAISDAEFQAFMTKKR